MRFFVSIFCIIVASFSLLGCGKSEEEKQQVGDTTASVSQDLQLFCLYGKVRQLKDENGNVYHFTEGGALDPSDGMVIERDSLCRITIIRTNKRETKYIWDSDNHLLSSSHSGITSTYRYDDRGYPLSSKTTADTWDMSVYRYLEFDEQHNWLQRECHSVGIKAETKEGTTSDYDNTTIEKRSIEYYP